MTAGWDAVERVQLAAPWDAYWIEVYLDPPLGVYVGMQRALREAIAQATAENLDALIRSMRPLVAETSLVDRAGEPLADWSVDTMGSRLISGIADAIKGVQDGGASADPLPPTPKRSASSPGPGSPQRRSPRNTRRGV